jgi:hypothetical protein
MIADVRALRLQPAPDVGLAAPAAVGVGGVEQVDPRVDRAVQQLDGLRLVLAHAVEGRRGPDAAEVAAAQRETRNLEAGRSQPAVLHHGKGYSVS